VQRTGVFILKMESFGKKPNNQQIYYALFSEDLSEGESARILQTAPRSRLQSVRSAMELIMDQGYRILDSENYFKENSDDPYL
jgi:hypothetical protein